MMKRKLILSLAVLGLFGMADVVEAQNVAVSNEEMMKAVLGNIKINKKKTNILGAHQFITDSGKNPETCESESVSLGTLDNIDVSVFKDFDYVALGHIHRPQSIGRDTVRYAGSPLKYSFSEKNDKKSMIIIDTSNQKIKLDFIPYEPLRDMKEFTGTFNELSKLPKTDDYVRLVLKDEEPIKDVKHLLEGRFTNIMEIAYDNAFTRSINITDKAELIEQKKPLELFETFYEMQNNRKPSKEQIKIVKQIFSELEETV